jgi:hypothetical protein
MERTALMIVTLTEFKSDLDRYLELVDDEAIVITREGKTFATLLSSPEQPSSSGKSALIRSLVGTLPSTATVEEARAERLAKHEAAL